MGGKSQPDMRGAAIAQGEVNREVVRDQTFANRPDQYTPFGYTTWNPYESVDPSTGEATTAWEQVSGLTPELQGILNKQIAIQDGRSDVAGTLTGRMGAEFGTPVDWTGLTPMGQVPTSQFTLPEESLGDPNAFRQTATDAMQAQANSRLDPQFQSQRQQLEIKMRNQGIGPEDEAWQSQMDSLGRQESDARNQAMWSSIGAGRDESNAMFEQMRQRNDQNFNQAYTSNQANFGQAMQGSAYANQIRQQQMTEEMQRRGFSLNEINALLSGQQVGMPQMPNFSNAAAAQPAPIYQGAADQASINAAANPFGAILGAGASLGAAALGNTALFTP